MLIKNDWEQQFSLDRMQALSEQVQALRDTRNMLKANELVMGATPQNTAQIDACTTQIETLLSRFREEWYPAMEALGATVHALRSSRKILEDTVKAYKQREADIDTRILTASAILGEEAVSIKTESGTFYSTTSTKYQPASPILIANVVVSEALEAEQNIKLADNPEAQHFVYGIIAKVTELFTKTMRAEVVRDFVTAKLQNVPEEQKESVLDSYQISAFELKDVKFKSK